VPGKTVAYQNITGRNSSQQKERENMKRKLFLTVLISFFAMLTIHCSSDSNSLVGNSNDLIQQMKDANLTVKEGSINSIDIIGMCCDTTKQMPMCYGNNPGAPYLTTYVPEGESQTVINSPLNYLGFPPAPSTVGNDKSRSYRFGPNEALVIVGKTPSAISLYYSYNVYIGLRCVTANCFAGASPNFLNDYTRRFATMVDALNHTNIRTTGTPYGFQGDSFGKDTMIIITSDRAVDRRIRESARKAGYSDAIINTIVIPLEYARLGLEYGKDEITVVQRLAARDESYLSNPPLRLFRVAGSLPLEPFPTPPLTVHGGKNASEKIRFQNAVAALKSSILKKYGDLGYTATEYKTDRWVPYGRDMLALDENGAFNGYDILADNSDAVYLRIPDLAGGQPADRGNTFSLSNSPDDFIIVYGVNHARAGSTIYSSISTYRHTMLNGGNSLWIEPEGTSADDYLKGTSYAVQSPYLYVLRVARSCSGVADKLCLEVEDCRGCPGQHCNENCRTTGADDLFLGMRGYIEPATGTGPSYDEIIWDSAIHFKK